ncbi:hypothetical protein [Clostridium botulinum]|uniref:Uncharacterized protein n=1 Tax=Clostridium botulinum (strain Langeland / NCTC 10281 / Type F) TaxID=441772 RepID=A7GFS7_CLOBL|nr:hypothetical protein [Clostridium botulinum]ABS41142.1 hypothetical protein CLI_2395 [Clostridium botulinum F str. Langeland]ADG00048.1 hypothetical protein CBF_2386 [Clostridium botulinum F str. 230613]KKM42400.1 hypothetical protein VT72_01795 [Clostridium botulinum]MBY6793117.1 hypothetical protein [Clostridium botulinum]MBY6937327.1 hypothetical protein [Clostridium botulinum]
MQFGKRLIFDKNTGVILNNSFGEIITTSNIDLRPKEIDFIDLPYSYNENNFKNAIEYHIDIFKNKNTSNLKDLIVITQYMERVETNEEKLKREKQELENQLLLKENKETGGIL